MKKVFLVLSVLVALSLVGCNKNETENKNEIINNNVENNEESGNMNSPSNADNEASGEGNKPSGEKSEQSVALEEIDENASIFKRMGSFEEVEVTDDYIEIWEDLDGDGEKEKIVLEEGYCEDAYIMKGERKVIGESPEKLYMVQNKENNEKEYFLSTYTADGMCYQSFALLKINKDLSVQRILSFTCDQEAEEKKRSELYAMEANSGADIGASLLEAHTLAFEVNEKQVTKEEYTKYANELKAKYRLLGEVECDDTLKKIEEQMKEKISSSYTDYLTLFSWYASGVNGALIHDENKFESIFSNVVYNLDDILYRGEDWTFDAKMLDKILSELCGDETKNQIFSLFIDSKVATKEDIAQCNNVYDKEKGTLLTYVTDSEYFDDFAVGKYRKEKDKNKIEVKRYDTGFGIGAGGNYFDVPISENESAILTRTERKALDTEYMATCMPEQKAIVTFTENSKFEYCRYKILDAKVTETNDDYDKIRKEQMNIAKKFVTERNIATKESWEDANSAIVAALKDENWLRENVTMKGYDAIGRKIDSSQALQNQKLTYEILRADLVIVQAYSDDEDCFGSQIFLVGYKDGKIQVISLHDNEPGYDYIGYFIDVDKMILRESRTTGQGGLIMKHYKLTNLGFEEIDSLGYCPDEEPDQAEIDKFCEQYNTWPIMNENLFFGLRR